MPAFIKSPKDEKRWAKAKKAVSSSRKKEESTFSDNDWALTNHIYQNMTKNDLVSILDIDLKKSNDKSNYEGEDDEENYFNDDEGDEDYQDEGQIDGDPSSEEDFYNEAGQEGEEAPSQAEIYNPKKEKSKKISNKYNEPTLEELNAIRQHTVPMANRIRQRAALEADAGVNPELHHHGKVLGSTLQNYQKHHDEYNNLISSPEYKNASLIDQMKMDREFSQNWRKNNPSHAEDAMMDMLRAHKAGAQGKEYHQQKKQADIKNLIQGGALGNVEGIGATSVAGLQHAGGVGDREDDPRQKRGASVQTDQATGFAIQNPEFIQKLREKYDIKSMPSDEDIESAGEGFKGAAFSDVKRLMGAEPSASPEVNKFFNHYYPLIQKNKNKTIAWLKSNNVPIDHNSVEAQVLNDAGMHALVHAVNDYDPAHPRSHGFANWASTKMKGLMRSAMKQLDRIPPEVRRMKGEFDKEVERRKASPPSKVSTSQPTQPTQPTQPAQPTEPTKSAHSVIDQSNHPEKTKIIRRIRSVQASRPMSQQITQPQSKPESQPETKTDRFKNFFDDDDTLSQLQNKKE